MKPFCPELLEGIWMQEKSVAKNRQRYFVTVDIEITCLMEATIASVKFQAGTCETPQGLHRIQKTSLHTCFCKFYYSTCYVCVHYHVDPTLEMTVFPLPRVDPDHAYSRVPPHKMSLRDPRYNEQVCSSRSQLIFSTSSFCQISYC